MPRNPVISIVDDDQSMREAMLDLMSSLGFVAEAFPSAEAFLQSDALRTTSCLIADLQMPGMNGLELLPRLSASGNAVPTILITAYLAEKVRTQALKAGVIGYLPKPFSDAELLGYLNWALEHRKAS